MNIWNDWKEAFQKAISLSNYKNQSKYLQDYWKTREKWCLAWRDITCLGHHTNNFSEITVRLLYEYVLRILFSIRTTYSMLILKLEFVPVTKENLENFVFNNVL